MKYVLAFILIIFIISSCKNKNLTYQVKVTDCSAGKIKGAVPKVPTKHLKTDSIKNIKIYLETSASMKGYINKPSVSDSGYIIKKIVPYLITDLDSKIASPELYTISSNPMKYQKGKKEFNTSLFNGSLITGGSTHIHEIIKHIINDNNPDTGASILISDCILDVGNNIGQKDKVGSAIYDLLTMKNISALLFQYYSEFNGNWYYDRRSSKRPYLGENITMHKRPFYIWVFGSPQNLSNLLKKKIFKNYSHSFIYGIKYTDIPALKLIQGTGKGKIYLSDKNEFTLIDYTKGDTANFVMGLNLSKFPDYIQNLTYLQNNLHIDKSYLKNKIKYTIYKQSDYSENHIYQFDNPGKIENEISNFTHVIEISINNINSISDTSFTISLNEGEPFWIKDATINDDVGKTSQKLEKKTYAFNIITKAFKDRFLTNNNECIFKINFKKIK